MWLFHFRLGNDSNNNNANGIGHAKRCLSIAKYIEKRGLDYIIVSSNNQTAKSYLNSEKIEYYVEENLEIILSKYNFSMIVSDINYAENELYETYKKHSMVTCIAPRGQGKYMANIAIKDVLLFDEKPKNNNYNKNIFSGTKYVVTNDKFNITKEKLYDGKIKKIKKSIVIFMGGVDNENITNEILKKLISFPKETLINIIIGPLNSNIKLLRKTMSKHNCNIKIHINPANFYEIIAVSEIGFFGAGITSYESAGLGTIPLNIAISKFHSKRSIEMEKMKLGLYVGDLISYKSNMIKKISQLNKHELKEMIQENGLKEIDGKGAERIAEKITAHQLKK